MSISPVSSVYSPKMNHRKKDSSLPHKNAVGDWIVRLEIQTNDQSRLKNIMSAELTYYNNLVRLLTARLKTDYNYIADLDSAIINEFIKISNISIHVKENTWMKLDLPDVFKYYNSDDTYTKNAKAKHAFMLETITSPIQLHSDIKSIMISQIFDFYIQQAKLIRANEKKSNPAIIESLEILEPQRKRHVQLLNSFCKVLQNGRDAVIHTPYTANPLIIRNFDLTKNPWFAAIVHQIGSDVPVSSTPWEIILRTSGQKYDMKYQDSVNKYFGSRNNLGGFKG